VFTDQWKMLHFAYKKVVKLFDKFCISTPKTERFSASHDSTNKQKQRKKQVTNCQSKLSQMKTQLQNNLSWALCKNSNYCTQVNEFQNNKGISLRINESNIV